MAVTAVSAAGLMACSVTLPYLTGRVIDDVVRGGDRDALAPLLWLVVAIVAARMCFGVVRRWVSGQVSLAVEYDLRRRLFAHLQRMSLSYYDRMPVGQLMSRATSDLQTVRFFLGYGQLWRSLYTDGFLRQATLTDPHSPGEFRVNGVLRNFDPWYEAFGVTPQNRLYLPPEARVRIW